MAKETQIMDIYRKKCSISEVGRKYKLNPKENLFYTHQIGKQLRSLTSSTDTSLDERIASTLWSVGAGPMTLENDWV